MRREITGLHAADRSVADQLTVGVCGVQRIRNLDGQRKQDFQFQRTPCNAVLQRRALQKLHHDEGLAVLLPDLMNRADIRMVQSRGRLRLALKAGQRLGVMSNFVRQELQRDKAV